MANNPGRSAQYAHGATDATRYDSLTANEIVKRLPRLSKHGLGRVDTYERKHANRKPVLNKIASLRGSRA
jgi:hypothetical protein